MFKKIFVVIVFCLLWIFFVYADENVTIDIGGDLTVNSGNTVNLLATFGGSCSNINLSTIYWMEKNDKWDRVSQQSWWTGNVNYSFVASETKQVKAKIECPIGEWPIFTNQVTAEDIITITVSTGSGWWGWWWWGSSYASRMRDEAQKLFYDSWTIEKINLILNVNEYPTIPFLQIYRNTIGWNWQIYYILEYSTWANFDSYLKFETTQLAYDFWKIHLDPEVMVHYFRVKAGYMGKLSNYSNVFTYYSEDYINISCPKCKKTINYDDVMIDEDVILDWLLDIECKACKQHMIK